MGKSEQVPTLNAENCHGHDLHAHVSLCLTLGKTVITYKGKC